VVLPSLLLVGILLAPALHVVLRHFNDDSTEGAYGLLGVATGIWAATTATAAILGRYSRVLT